MAGAWELKYAGPVLVAILHTDVTTIAWSFGLRNLIIPGGYPPMPLAGMPFDMARNCAAMRALEIGASHIFYYDSDVIAPRDTIPRLMAHDKMVVSGIYARRSPPVSVPVMLKNGQWITSYPPNSLIEVDLVGAGCLLIKRELLESFPPQRPSKHWFDWRVDMQGVLPREECLSEDFTFNLACRKMGIKTYVDTSIICRHIGYGESTPGSFVPLEACPIT